jgi:hypothetical protein
MVGLLKAKNKKRRRSERELKERVWRSFSKWGSFQSKALKSGRPINTAHISGERAINSARINGVEPLTPPVLME